MAGYGDWRPSGSLACQYCGADAVLTSSAEIYGGRDYGKIYICRPCGAYVGCHKGTEVPLGTLANEELRAARKAAHAAFDPIHKKGYKRRDRAYWWLAEKLNIPADV